MTNRSDNFNRNDGSNYLPIGTPSDGGSDWVVVSGSSVIPPNGGKGGLSGAAPAVMYLECSASDVDIRLKIIDAANADIGIALRWTNNSNYFFATFGSSFSVRLSKFSGGSYSELNGGNAHWGTGSVTGDVIRVVANGSSLSVYYNDVLRLGPYTDTLNQTATKHGVHSWDNSATFDDFSSTDIAAASTVPLGVITPQSFGFNPGFGR